MMLDPLRRFWDAVGRVTPGPMLVRAGIFVTALGALLTAYPTVVVTGRLVAALVLLAAAPAVAPRGRATTLVVLAAVCGWLLATMGFQEPVTLFRLLGLAGLLYLLHSLAALGAALPLDAVVAPEVLARWISRAMLVVAASAVPALVAVAAADALHGAFLLASLVGLVIAVGVAALLTHLLRRE
ncbi:MAG: hypothetical protein IRZ05_10435 [Micromonosporaceae bacterium]|jgi:hypothetical protein|nr:hypothetical protein [Micromonosporaceae bacterium]